MAINPNIAALTVVNEAIGALDYEPVESLEVDDLINEARELLFAAREMLTRKPWPEEAHKSLDTEAFERWHSEKAALQRRQGRQ